MAEDFSSLDAAADFRKFPGGETDRISYRKWKVYAELETDQESAEWSEDTESPRSVARVGKWTAKNIHVFVHSQVLRIREEDSHIGEDVGERLNAKDKLSASGYSLDSHLDVVLFSRPILPASPLSGKSVH